MNSRTVRYLVASCSRPFPFSKNYTFLNRKGSNRHHCNYWVFRHFMKVVYYILLLRNVLLVIKISLRQFISYSHVGTQTMIKGFCDYQRYIWTDKTFAPFHLLCFTLHLLTHTRPIIIANLPSRRSTCSISLDFHLPTHPPTHQLLTLPFPALPLPSPPLTLHPPHLPHTWLGYRWYKI